MVVSIDTTDGSTLARTPATLRGVPARFTLELCAGTSGWTTVVDDDANWPPTNPAPVAMATTRPAAAMRREFGFRRRGCRSGAAVGSAAASRSSVGGPAGPSEDGETGGEDGYPVPALCGAGHGRSFGLC